MEVIWKGGHPLRTTGREWLVIFVTVAREGEERKLAMVFINLAFSEETRIL